jgi:hypothetical protein
MMDYKKSSAYLEASPQSSSDLRESAAKACFTSIYEFFMH